MAFKPRMVVVAASMSIEILSNVRRLVSYSFSYAPPILPRCCVVLMFISIYDWHHSAITLQMGKLHGDVFKVDIARHNAHSRRFGVPTGAQVVQNEFTMDHTAPLPLLFT